MMYMLSYIGVAETEDKGFVSSLAVTYKKTQQIEAFWWYHLVGIVWTSEFILACQQMVVAGAVAMWYFTR